MDALVIARTCNWLYHGFVQSFLQARQETEVDHPPSSPQGHTTCLPSSFHEGQWNPRRETGPQKAHERSSKKVSRPGLFPDKTLNVQLPERADGYVLLGPEGKSVFGQSSKSTAAEFRPFQ
eukprot:s169_g4.t1